MPRCGLKLMTLSAGSKLLLARRFVPGLNGRPRERSRFFKVQPDAATCSLLRRTQDKLVTQGYRCIKLDMGALSFERSVSQWYRSLAREIARGLGQPRDFAETLLAREERQPASRRFIQFLQESLRLTDAPLVIFLDEVEGLLQMPKAVASDFLVTLRSYTDDRDSTPLYRRLCFCLMGACTAAELMPGAQCTHCDTAREISLTDFDWPSVRAGLLPLFAKKGPWSEAALARAYYWTQGHPAFTKCLCAQLCASPDRELTVGTVDRLVREIFIGPLVHGQEDFLEIERRLCAGPCQRVRRRLALYQRLLRGDRVPARRHDLVHRNLHLSGLAKLIPGDPPCLASLWNFLLLDTAREPGVLSGATNADLSC